MGRFSDRPTRVIIPAVRMPFRANISPCAAGRKVLALRGRNFPAIVRPPLVKFPPPEIERRRRAFAASVADRDVAVSAVPLAAE
jgi:hypothetical protein